MVSCLNALLAEYSKTIMLKPLFFLSLFFLIAFPAKAKGYGANAGYLRYRYGARLR